MTAARNATSRPRLPVGEAALRGSYFVRLNDAHNSGGWSHARDEALDLVLYWYREAEKARNRLDAA